MSDVSLEPTSDLHSIPAGAAVVDDERPPACPSCNKRLVILATHSVRDNTGAMVRQQLWGCPKGHSTATRRAGVFSAVSVMADLAG